MQLKDLEIKTVCFRGRVLEQPKIDSTVFLLVATELSLQVTLQSQKHENVCESNNERDK